MSKEIWKNIKEYEGIYQVSNLGRVKRIGSYRNQTKEWPSDRILKACSKDNDYLSVVLSKDGISSQKYIHRLVAQAFIPNPEAKDGFINNSSLRCRDYRNHIVLMEGSRVGWRCTGRSATDIRRLTV